MINKLLSVEFFPIVNIGDYIQALAASQFFPNIDGFVNREGLADYYGEECRVIMNGWFMHNPDQWPPNEKIHPFFISFHINVMAAEKMLDENGINYLRQFEPIGCRDVYTCNLLKGHGIEAYFSGCLTLTLGRDYCFNGKRNGVFFVDPYIPKLDSIYILYKDIVCLLIHPLLNYKISRKFIFNQSIIKRSLKIARFVRLYSRIFTNETLTSAIYISQQNQLYSTLNNKERMQEAERLVRLYARACFVVTNRIHCALPCLGLGTSVYFTHKIGDDLVSSCRYGGLIDLLNVINVDSFNIFCDFDTNGKLSLDNVKVNKKSWIKIADLISKECSAFASE